MGQTFCSLWINFFFDENVFLNRGKLTTSIFSATGWICSSHLVCILNPAVSTTRYQHRLIAHEGGIVCLGRLTE